MKKIRLLLIEDNLLLRDGITAILKKAQDIEILSSSGLKKSTFVRILRLNPNMILLDMSLRSHNSLLIVATISKKFPDAKIIVMDLSPVKGDIMEFVKAGATGFILKDATPGDFIRTIRAVAAGGKVLPALMAESLFFQIAEQGVKGGESVFKDLLRFTGRELEVAKLVGEGVSNHEIAGRLDVPAGTVTSCIHNIMEKLSLHSRF
ncbi:MAG: response regulator transcription factor [Balneolales bacterium]